MEKKNKGTVAKVLRSFFVKNLFTYFILIIVPVLIFGIFVSSAVERYISRLVRSNTNTVFSISSASIESLLLDSMHIGIYIDNHSDIILALLSAFQGEGYGNSRQAFSDLKTYIENLSVTIPYLHSVCLYKQGSDVIIVGGELRTIADFDNSEFIESIQAPFSGQEIQRHNIKLNSFEERGVNVVTFVTSLKYGIKLAINIRESDIWSVLDIATQYPQEILILENREGDVLAGNKWYRNSEALPFEKYMTQSYDILSGDYKLVSLIPNSVVHEVSYSVFKVTYFFMAMALIVSAFISVILTRISYRRVNAMLNLFEVNGGLEDVNFELESRFGMYNYIIETVARNYARETNLREKVVKAELEVTRTQLSALQYQINPHFIFNTLQMIDLAINDETLHDEASHIISLFSTILRYAIQDSSSLVTLEEEINISRLYIRLQEIRFKERVIILWDYDEEEIKGLKCIRMLFQPLIENIFQHGLHADGEKTVAYIRLYRGASALHISIANNGPGLSKDALMAIKQSFCSDVPPGRHIGLYNVDRRLKLMFGEECGLNLLQSEGRGFLLKIIIPLTKIENDTFL